MSTAKNFDHQTRQYHAAINRGLELRMDALEGKVAERLLSAMRYSLLAGGKRIRPILLLSTWEMVRSQATQSGDLPAAQETAGEPGPALDLALAIEMIHTYSLIHDDLPAMDDDDLRRGKPTNHKAYDEATAILAGDALLNLAYERMLQVAAEGGEAAWRAAQLIAKRAGAQGMISGQQMDLDAERRRDESFGVEDLVRLQELKTGGLIEASVLAGATLAGADEYLQEALAAFSQNLGLAFQIRDDLLDVQASQEMLGKTPGKDVESGKMTFVTLLGTAEAERSLALATQRADGVLAELARGGYQTAYLGELTAFLLTRNH